MKFTPRTHYQMRVEWRTPTINHTLAAFTENKRYRRKPRAFDDVVNRNVDSVYQTDEVFDLSWWRAKGAAFGAATTK
jgi:hypothetical protein